MSQKCDLTTAEFALPSLVGQLVDERMSLSQLEAALNFRASAAEEGQANCIIPTEPRMPLARKRIFRLPAPVPTTIDVRPGYNNMGTVGDQLLKIFSIGFPLASSSTNLSK